MIKAIAHPNIALAKYWGKRNEELNLPAVGSVSITLDALKTETEIQFIENEYDIIEFNGKLPAEDEQKKLSKFIDKFRQISGIDKKVELITNNNFPTSAGLASSASGFAALSKASSKLFGLEFSDRELSVLARQGSGSAARSLFGGFVEWHKGTLEDGSDSFAEQIADKSSLPLSIIIAVTSKESKKISSRIGMHNSSLTSPFYKAFVDTSPNDILEIKNAILEKDFMKLADFSMKSTVKMHAVMMTSNPPLFYWNHKTYEIIELVQDLYNNGENVFFTIDAGPQVKIVTTEGNAPQILNELKQINQIDEIYVCNLGNGAEIIEETH
jgi:diphosphomevalonate decarboxylase